MARLLHAHRLHVPTGPFCTCKNALHGVTLHTEWVLQAVAYSHEWRMCSGILVMRRGLAAVGAATAWAERLRLMPQEGEVAAFEAAAQLAAAQEAAPDGRLLHAFGGHVSLGVLPLSAFPNGHVYGVQHLPQVVQLLLQLSSHAQLPAP